MYPRTRVVYSNLTIRAQEGAMGDFDVPVKENAISYAGLKEHEIFLKLEGYSYRFGTLDLTLFCIGSRMQGGACCEGCW